MFNKTEYIVDKVISRLQNNLDSVDIQHCKSILYSLPNLDMVNQPSETFEDSAVGWLTIAKILENLVISGKELCLQNIIDEYPLKQKTKMIVRDEDVYDENLLNDESELDTIRRILQEHGEENYCEDFFEDELTEEGLRQASFLDGLSTSFDAEDFVIKQKVPVVTVQKNQEIVSPWGNTDIMRISTETFLDIEENKEFRIREV